MIAIDNEYLHNRFYGAADKYIEEEFSKHNYTCGGDYFCTHTYMLQSPNDLSKEVELDLTNKYSNYTDYGYSNIVLLEQYCDMVKSIQLKINGNNVNKIYPHINSATRVLEFADDNTILPAFSENVQVVIVVNFLREGTIRLSVDEMKIKNPLNFPQFIEVMLKQTQYNGANSINSGCINKIPIYFNHPVKKITILPDDHVNYNTTLIFPTDNDNDNEDYQYKLSSSDRKCVYEFKNTINYSNMKGPHLLVETDAPTKIHIIAETLNIMVMYSNMIGMRFSK